MAFTSSFNKTVKVQEVDKFDSIMTALAIWYLGSHVDFAAVAKDCSR